MDPDAALALIGATAVLVAIPGPNVALIVANTIARGLRFGAMTAIGTTIGVAVQLAVVVLGLAALLEFAASAFMWLKDECPEFAVFQVRIGKPKLENELAGGKVLWVNVVSHLPHQIRDGQISQRLLRLDIALGPFPHGIQNGFKVDASLSPDIVDLARGGVLSSFDQPLFDKLFQSPGQERCRDIADTAPNVVETRRAAPHFSQNRNCPARLKNFAGVCDRTYQSVRSVAHGLSSFDLNLPKYPTCDHFTM